ncbi:MAG: hypothetical protein KDA37_01125 [Planctomycetales bacterium]|nr:hypothetical protein [Planctomycetales bacterium]
MLNGTAMGVKYPELLFFAWFTIIVLSMIIVVPVFRGKRALLTARSFVLLGGVIYTGVSCLEVYYSPYPWPELTWFTPTYGEVQRFFGYSLLFYVCFFLFCRFLPKTTPVSRPLVGRCPEPSLVVTGVILAACFVISSVSPLLQDVVGVGEIAMNFGQVSVAVAATFAAAYFVRSRFSPLGLAILIAVLLVAGLQAMFIFHGRRLLLSVLMGPVVVLYWTRLRHWRPTKLFVIQGVAGMSILAMLLVFSTFRHYDAKGKNREERSRTGIVERLSSVRLEAITRQLNDIPAYFAQHTAYNAMLLMRLTENKTLDVKPLESAKHVLTYPIPRRVWPNKPRPLGVYIVREVLGMPYKTSWGLNVVGISVAEGGLYAVVVYALMISIVVRFFDDAIYAEPDNPFLFALLAAASPHLVCWVRGGIGGMTINCIDALALVTVLSIASRLLFGAARRSAVTPAYRRAPIDQLTG